MPFLNNGSQLCISTGKLIDLVDEQQYRQIELLHFLKEVHVLLGVLNYVGNVEQNIGVLQSRLRERQH